MLTRARLLVAAELAGFGAIAAAAVAGGLVMGGWLTAAAVGLFVGGAEAVYLANAYAEEGAGDDEH